MGSTSADLQFHTSQTASLELLHECTNWDSKKRLYCTIQFRLQNKGEKRLNISYTPKSGMESGKYFWKKFSSSSSVVIFSNSSNGMKRVQVKVLSFKTHDKHSRIFDWSINSKHSTCIMFKFFKHSSMLKPDWSVGVPYFCITF